MILTGSEVRKTPKAGRRLKNGEPKARPKSIPQESKPEAPRLALLEEDAGESQTLRRGVRGRTEEDVEKMVRNIRGRKCPVKLISPAEKGFKKALGRKLDTHNRAAIGSNFDWKNVEVEARNAQGKMVGGLYGGTYWGWLHVKMLWVDQAYRKHGVGTGLLKKAGILAKKRGCHHVCLSTFSFHAPGFYRKLGFKRYASLKPFIKGSTRFYLHKRIS